jgi:hypothetical protein
MIRKVLALLAVVVAAWWLWTGPIRDMRTAPQEQEDLERNAQKMASCIERRRFASGMGGSTAGDPQAECAREYGLYLESGQWRTLKRPRN